MAFKLPWSNFHELNLDWVLEKMKELSEKVDAFIGSAVPSNDPPVMDGTASAGSSVNYARGDHVHPTDTSRASASDLTALSGQLDYEVGELANSINSVDAKIGFNSAAPVMDGVASPGSSAYQARADHVHPTDTSRASQVQVDTLQAAVDNLSGSAYPYANNPKMDGVASPGTVAAYARGDHVHPTDTTRLSTNGGEIFGDLLVDSVRTFKVTNATGWLRVGNLPKVPGSFVEIAICKRGEGDDSLGEVHKINLDILRYGAKFTAEYSYGDAWRIDKIRYTDAGKLDIHVVTAQAMYVGVGIDKYASSKDDLSAITLINPAWVDDAPDGESILTIYTFQQRPYSQQYQTVFGKGWYFWMRGYTVSMASSANIGEAIPIGSHEILTLPTGWRPVANMDIPLAIGASDAHIHIVSSTGVVSLVNGTAMAIGDPCSVSGTWAAN